MRKKTRELPPVVWRDGVHIAGTPLWCDASRARDACFVSSAEVRIARRHHQLIATAETLARLRKDPDVPALAAPVGRPFNLGALRLELFPSAHAPGSASLLVESAGRRIVYAGAVGPAAEVRPCDVLVVDATLAAFTLPPRDETLARLRAYVAQNDAPVLVAPPLTTALELARELAGVKPIRAQRAVHDACRRAGITHVLRLDSEPRPGELTLRSVGPGARVAPGGEFPLADRVDGPGLARYIAQVRARDVYLLHPPDGAIDVGMPVRRLGPPRQLALAFE
jgi:hypothetical protein